MAHSLRSSVHNHLATVLWASGGRVPHWQKHVVSEAAYLFASRKQRQEKRLGAIPLGRDSLEYPHYLFLQGNVPNDLTSITPKAPEGSTS